jgi:hypothetical protein
MPPSPRRFDLEDAVNRPGTYFNPVTEMLIVVDDSAAVDAEIFEDGDETEWVLVSDEAPIDETRRDETIERFEARHHPGASGAIAAEEDDVEEVDELEPDDDVVDDDDGVEELEGF